MRETLTRVDSFSHWNLFGDIQVFASNDNNILRNIDNDNSDLKM